MKKITSFKIGGEDRPVKIKYSVIREFIDKSTKIDTKKTTLFQMHDFTLESVLKMLDPCPFNSVEELKDALEWDEYKTIDDAIAEMLTGGPADPQKS